MQIKTIMRYHLTAVSMPIVKQSTNKKCYRGYTEKGTLLHCWWECKLVQPLWWSVSKKLNTELPSVQSLSHVQLFLIPWTAACQASLSITSSRHLLKLMSIESVMPSNHLILCRSPLLLPLVFPSIRVFSNESVLRIRWPKYWNFSFSISPSNEYSGLISFRMDLLDLLAVQETFKSPLQHHSSKASITLMLM